jgi:hypothetical protein
VAGRTILEVHSHARGPWLVRVGRRVLAVPPPIGRALLPLHGTAVERRRLAAGLGAGPPGEPAAGPAAAAVVAAWLAGGGQSSRGRGRGGRRAAGRSLPVRVPLLPAALVRRAAVALVPLAAWPALVLMTVAGLTAALVVRPWSAPCVLSLPGLLLFAAGAVWHELGHAAALQREGYGPGGIGAGVLICVPVLYADVSAAGLLPRSGRLRVDLAGMAFQTGIAGALTLVGAVPGLASDTAAVARTAAVASLLAVVYGLLPLPRTDGSWALRDALAEAPPGSPGARLRQAVHLLQFGFVGLACALLPARLLGLAAWAGARLGLPLEPQACGVAARALSALALLWWLSRAVGAARAARRRRSPPL